MEENNKKTDNLIIDTDSEILKEEEQFYNDLCPAEERELLKEKIRSYYTLTEKTPEFRKLDNQENRKAKNLLSDWLMEYFRWKIDGKYYQHADTIIRERYITRYSLSDKNFLAAFRQEKERYKYFDAIAFARTMEKSYPAYNADKDSRYYTYFSGAYKKVLHDVLVDGRYEEMGIKKYETDEYGNEIKDGRGRKKTKERKYAENIDEIIGEKLGNETKKEQLKYLMGNTDIPKDFIQRFLYAEYKLSMDQPIKESQTDEDERTIGDVMYDNEHNPEYILEDKESTTRSISLISGEKNKDRDLVYITAFVLNFEYENVKIITKGSMDRLIHKGFAAFVHNVKEEDVTFDFIVNNPVKVKDKDIAEYLGVTAANVSMQQKKIKANLYNLLQNLK